MSDTNERSVASAGSVAGEPVAWIAVFDGDDADGEFVWPNAGLAREWASTRPGVQIAPLYRHPQPTLTDEEVKAVEWCIFQQAVPQKTAVTMRRMLERLK